MLKYLQNIRTKSAGRMQWLVVLFFIFCINDNINAQNSSDFKDSFKLGIRLGLNMATTTIDNNGLEIGGALGIGGKYNFTKNSSTYAELQYSMLGKSFNYMEDQEHLKVKIYGKTRLHYLCIPIVYKYYFTDVLGIEAGPQFGFCLGGNEKEKVGNGSWVTNELTTNDYNVFDFGVVMGVYTNELIPQDNLFVCLRAYIGLTDVMKDAGSNKNICIQFGIGYVIGK